MKPFIKWVGGKRQILAQVLPLVPEKFNVYHEPFVGGGAVYFALVAAGRIKTASLNDLNERLMATYWAVQQNPAKIVEYIQQMPDTPEEYALRRAELNAIPKDFGQECFERVAALMLYLNRTCFNGLYRENRSGGFNSPYGVLKPGQKRTLVDAETLRSASEALQHAGFSCECFEAALNGGSWPEPSEGDFVYLDPPYMPVTDTSFTAYVGGGDIVALQRNLAEECKRLHGIGVKFLVSNSDHPLIHDLFKDFTISTVQARRSVNRDASGRGKVNELLVRNY
jgi:DNA adenine methylase